jgi:hypothetical protein
MAVYRVNVSLQQAIAFCQADVYPKKALHFLQRAKTFDIRQMEQIEDID